MATVDRKATPPAAPAPLDGATADLVERLMNEGDPAVFALKERFSHEALSQLRQKARVARKKIAAGADAAATRRELAESLARLES
jgi:hypothetical protein